MSRFVGHKHCFVLNEINNIHYYRNRVLSLITSSSVYTMTYMRGYKTV